MKVDRLQHLARVWIWADRNFYSGSIRRQLPLYRANSYATRIVQHKEGSRKVQQLAKSIVVFLNVDLESSASLISRLSSIFSESAMLLVRILPIRFEIDYPKSTIKLVFLI